MTLDPRAVEHIAATHATLGDAIDDLVDRHGFRLDLVLPADNPMVAELSRDDLRVRLEHTGGQVTGRRLDGTEERRPSVMPALVAELVVSRAGDNSFGVGRAAMDYRDLIPGRQGGRFIASHIRIAEAGPVPDRVHYHDIRFQLIFCVSGWVRVVYEDQGPPFVLEPGDCVLQPPDVRHRVLESSAGLDVVEVSCPATHPTRFDHDLDLPTPVLAPDRDFGGQRFHRHRCTATPWRPTDVAGVEARDLELVAASGGIVGGRVVRAAAVGASDAVIDPAGELLFVFVLEGLLTLSIGGREIDLLPHDAVTIPAGRRCMWSSPTVGVRFLEVTVPARGQSRELDEARTII